MILGVEGGSVFIKVLLSLASELRCGNIYNMQAWDYKNEKCEKNSGNQNGI